MPPVTMTKVIGERDQPDLGHQPALVEQVVEGEEAVGLPVEHEERQHQEERQDRLVAAASGASPGPVAWVVSSGGRHARPLPGPSSRALPPPATAATALPSRIDTGPAPAPSPPEQVQTPPQWNR